MRSYGIRIGLAVGVVVVYFFILRPLRAEFNSFVYQPVVEKAITLNEGISYGEESSSVSNLLFWENGADSYSLHIKVPFGLHFLLAVLGLIFIRAEKPFYLYLLSVQVLGSLAALLFLYVGSLTVIQLLVISDLLLRYLVPLCSLGMVPFAFIYQKQATHEG